MTNDNLTALVIDENQIRGSIIEAGLLEAVLPAAGANVVGRLAQIIAVERARVAWR